MKIGLTGHTKGIGLATYELLSESSYVAGFSRANGYNIATNVDEIWESCQDFDVFINNAWHPTGQYNLLKRFIDGWDGQNKTIINISSIITYMPNTRFDEEARVYYLSKCKLNKLARARTLTFFPYVINLILGNVDTTMSRSKSPKLFPVHVAEFIKKEFIDRPPVIREVVLMHELEST